MSHGWKGGRSTATPGGACDPESAFQRGPVLQSPLLKVLQRIVNQTVLTQGAGDDQAAGLTIDLSRINMEKLRDEFGNKIKRKHTVIADIRQIVEATLAQMLARNPQRMNFVPDPPYTEVEKLQVANEVYRHVWQQSVSHGFQPTPRSPSAAGGISAR